MLVKFRENFYFLERVLQTLQGNLELSVAKKILKNCAHWSTEINIPKSGEILEYGKILQ